MMIIELSDPLIAKAAIEHDVPLALVQAIITVESSCDSDAYNPEPHYRYLWDIEKNLPFRALTPTEIKSQVPPGDFPRPNNVPRDAEWWAQQASWGLMQVMGGTARWLGFKDKWITSLLRPEVGVHWGCATLQYYLQRYDDDASDAISAYNQGSNRKLDNGKYENQVYVDKVLTKIESIQPGISLA